MANFQKGYTFTPHDVVTPNKLNNLTDQGSLNNVWNNVVAAAAHIPWLIDSIGSPITGDVRIPSTYLLEAYYSGAWNTQESELVYLTLQNNSAVNLVAGNVCCADPASAGGFIIPTFLNVTPATRPLGVLLDNINAGASGRVAYRGEVILNLNPYFGNAKAGSLLIIATDILGSGTYDQAASIVGTAVEEALYFTSDRVFGIMLGDQVGTTCTAFIWK